MRFSASSSRSITILTLTAACGLGASGRRPSDLAEDFDAAPSPKRTRKAAEWDDGEEAGPDEPGWGIVSLGALFGVMSLRGAARRWSRRRTHAEEDDLLAPSDKSRRAAGERASPGASRCSTGRGDTARAAPIPGEMAEDWAAEPARHLPGGPAQPRPGRPRRRPAHAGARRKRDCSTLAITSFRPDPAGGAEGPPGPIGLADALEQNATLLEEAPGGCSRRARYRVHAGPWTLYELEPAPGTSPPASSRSRTTSPAP